MRSEGLIQRALVQIATVGPIGRMPIAPGTWGSAFAVLIWWYFLSQLPPLVFWLILIVLSLIFTYVSNCAEKTLGKDAHPIIVDELIGQWIALAFCSKTILMVVIAFFLFRLFDIWKPFPIYISQKLKGGWGIMIDDVLAGGYAIVVIAVIRRLWLD
ncbi:MAG: phosphatidylglycerophosphatase A [Candidatus Hatepunaea meridiana]|nr:phosphatidylglycerophosphatase A [Candidatus Hatepunaea meridiana]